MQVHTPSTSTLKCPTCKMAFESESLHKQHYKSDFHRYNLKRSMVNLPPATIEQFSTKRLQTRNQRQTNFQCGQCRKTFSTLQTLNQHAETKKHDINKPLQERPKLAPKPKVSLVKNQNLCLFCLKQSSSLQQNLTHMSTFHSFFIAQQDYCKDKKALLFYLQDKVEVGMLCIFCENKGAHDFTSGDSVRKHMLSKNHTFMNTENGFEEYENFYDFSELFKAKLEQQKFFQAPVGINFQKVKVIVDEQKANKQNKKQKVNKKKQDKMQEEQVDGEQQWEDQDESDDGEWSEESSEQQQQTKMIEQQNENDEQIKQKKKRKVKAYQIMVPTLTSTDELLLPNGKTLGHRKYRRFYKQSIKLNWFQNNQMKMLQHSVGTQNALVLRNRLMELMKRQSLMKNYKVKQDKHKLKVGMNNNMLMKFFRTSCSLG